MNCIKVISNYPGISILRYTAKTWRNLKCNLKCCRVIFIYGKRYIIFKKGKAQVKQFIKTGLFTDIPPCEYSFVSHVPKTVTDEIFISNPQLPNVKYDWTKYNVHIENVPLFVCKKEGE